ncbi:DNA internalization-related competence protein ComEC/Rec2 [Aminipila butyrica]|uniref:DNA internalization-related competence protein ComEC/Rec2 n=1 Tax=Aminipila butyrica TaxID=433296 RepID=A0A858BW77_9FIRM|nr:DNA internalization-related competence protein ComEC/Rec2 [Aminipila butyrica]QIB69847.1 DNA internalization-related competence protein ComEC/Rec2 [Aminipila butyrica]
MRRPVAFLCGAYVLGMTAENFLKLHIMVLATAAAAIGVAIVTAGMVWRRETFSGGGFALWGGEPWKKQSLCGIAILIALLGAVQYRGALHETGVLERNQGQFLTISGQVIAAVEKDEETHQLTVVVEELEGVGKLKSRERMLLSLYGSCPDYYQLQGQQIQAAGVIELPATQRNPKAFDYRLYLKTKEISTIMSLKPNNIQLSNQVRNPYLHYIATVKYVFQQNLSGIFDRETSGLLIGMIFGDTGGIEEALYESFQKNGICHVLSVSGLHVGCLYMCINALFGGRRNLKVYGAVLAALCFYASLANFSPTVMRALLMIILHIFCKYMYCRYDMLTSAAVTMAGLLFFNPLSLLNLGFQLSYLAIFTLAVVTPAAERLWSRNLAGVISIQAGMVPISMYTFNYFSFSSFIANIPIIFLSGLLIPLGMVLLLFSMLASVLGAWKMPQQLLDGLFQIVGLLIDFFTQLLLLVNRLVFVDHISYRYVLSPPLWIILLYYGLLFFLSSEACRILWQRKDYRPMGRLILLILAISLLWGNASKDGFEKVQMTFVDVGQGDCLLITTPKGRHVLVDSGGSSRYDVGKKLLLPYLLKNGVRDIDLAVITHFHTDHAGGLYSLARELPVKRLGLYEGNRAIAGQIQEQTGISRENFLYLSRGQRLQVEEGLEIQVLYPEEKTMEEYRQLAQDQKDENESCLVMKVTLQGVSVVMTGDIDEEGEKRILEGNPGSLLKSDILKVAHHGSKYSSSTAFLDQVQPRLAVIQVGKNNYGHPAPQTLERLEEINCQVYRNDQQGAVGIEIGKGGKLKIHTMI